MFAYLEGVIVLKLSPIIGVGDSFEHVGALRVIDKEGMWVKELDKYETSVLTMMQMKDCRPSTSPKLEKQTEPGDDDPCEHPELYRSAVCTILYMTKRRPDLQATTRWMCKRLRNPNKKSWRQLVKTVRYIKGSRDLATFMSKAGKPDIIEAFLDGDWACDDLDRKSTSGGYLMVGGCRLLHSHSRTTGQHESEIMSMSDAVQFEVLWDGASSDCPANRRRCCQSILPQERCPKKETSGCQALLAAGGTGEGKLQSETGRQKVQCE